MTQTLSTEGSTSQANDDGSTTTSWPDGTSRITYEDGTMTTTYPDGRVLNEETDGTRTLNDQYGTALDPDTGQPLQQGGAAPVVDPPATVEHIVGEVLEGSHALSSLAEAAAILADAEAVLAIADPLDGVFAVAIAVLEVYRAMDSDPRAYGTAGYCYGIMYGALDMGEPPYPQGAYSLDSDSAVQTKQQRFADGAGKAAAELGNGTDGTVLRNRVLLRTAYLSRDPTATLDELWTISCRHVDNDFYADHMRLSWPETGITER